MKRFGLITLFISVILSLPAYTENPREDNSVEWKKHYSFALQNKKIKNYEEAQRQYEKAIACNDSQYVVFFSYGDLLISMDKKEKAEEVLKKALALNSNHYESAAMLARLYYERGDYEKTLMMYETMYRLKPENTQLLASISSLKEYLGAGESALEDLVKLIETGDDSYDNLMRASRLAFKQEEVEKTRKFAIMALDKKPGDREALLLAGKTSVTLGEWETAAGFYRQLAEIDSTSIEILVQIEDIYRASSDRTNLIWALERHHKLIPEDVNVLGELCELFYAEGMLDKGVVYVNKGLKLNAGDGRFRILLGENYRALGQQDKALEQYRIALQDPRWKSSAQRLIWQIEKPESDEEKKEKEFFSRGKK